MLIFTVKNTPEAIKVMRHCNSCPQFPGDLLGECSMRSKRVVISAICCCIARVYHVCHYIITIVCTAPCIRRVHRAVRTYDFPFYTGRRSMRLTTVVVFIYFTRTYCKILAWGCSWNILALVWDENYNLFKSVVCN